MDGRAIAAGAVSDGGLRRLTTEMSGPRPAGIVAGVSVERLAETLPDADQKSRATRP